VTASISAAVRGTNDHLAIGIGGTRQAVLSAAALRCLGGELQAQLWPTSRTEVAAAREAGVEDLERLFTTEDLAPGEVIVVASGSRGTVRGPTRSSCARAATGCASWTGSTSSRASGARKSACRATDGDD